MFSQPFISVPNVIVVRSDGESLLGLGLAGKRVLLSDPERVQQQAPQSDHAARSAEQALQRLRG